MHGDNGYGSVSVVVPTLNEEENIGWVLKRIPPAYRVHVVDGRSEDRTVEVARRSRRDVDIVMERSPGKGVALRAGFSAAKGQFVVALDADGSMDPAELPRYVSFLELGFDLVKGSRNMEGGGSEDLTRLRSTGNKALVRIANTAYRARFTDLCYGFFGIRRTLIDHLSLEATGFEIEAELILRAKRAGMRIAEVPTFEYDRRFGVSKLRTFRDGARVLRTIVRETGWKPAQALPESHTVIDLRDPVYNSVPNDFEQIGLLDGDVAVASNSPTGDHG